MNKMYINRFLVIGLVGFITLTTSCKKEAGSLFDPDYTSSHPTPVIDNIIPANGYLAGVDSIIINGENFASDLDSMTINFGGVPGTIHRSNQTQMIVRPGYVIGDDIPVRISVRGSEFFSNVFSYKLDDPFNFYKGTDDGFKPKSPFAIDDEDNIYAVIDNINTGYLRYTKIATDGTITLDDVKGPTEKKPDKTSYPSDSKMRFNNYSSLTYAGNDLLLMTQQGLRAIFQKTFGDGKKETLWADSETKTLKIKDVLIDDKGFLWVVGLGSSQIHRFDMATKEEELYPFAGEFTSVALFEDKLFVAGDIEENVEIWSFPIDAGGALDVGAAEKYFDFTASYSGAIKDMLFASNGDLIIATDSDESLIRVFPNGTHEVYYDGVTEKGAFALTWRSDRFMVVGTEGTEGSIYFLDTFDKTRAGIY